MRQFLKNNGLSITMFGLFFIFLIGQSIAGFFEYNAEQILHHQSAIDFISYLQTGQFLEAVFENWESEFLQMGLYVILTAFLYQKGSAESKSLSEKNRVDEDPKGIHFRKGMPWPVRRGGWVLKLYECSLSVALLFLFLVSFLLHAKTGAAEFQQNQADHGNNALVSMWQYMSTSRFWFQSFQNWQSEFLSIGVLAVLSIYLRQKGSPESKPVAASHSEEVAD